MSRHKQTDVPTRLSLTIALPYRSFCHRESSTFEGNQVPGVWNQTAVKWFLSKCTCKAFLYLNSFPHKSHRNCIMPVWLVKCALRSFDAMKPLLQYEQWYGYMPRCQFSCFFRLPFVVQLLLHMEQINTLFSWFCNETSQALLEFHRIVTGLLPLYETYSKILGSLTYTHPTNRVFFHLQS